LRLRRILVTVSWVLGWIIVVYILVAATIGLIRLINP
jgi:hypothetical protein